MCRFKKAIFSLIIGFFFVNILPQPLHAVKSYANEPDVIAESAVLIDAKTGDILYGKNENSRMYPASITKLMTALIAIETRKPTDIILMSQEAVFGIERNSSHIGLDVDEQITLDQGLHALLLNSANEVANGIAELCDGSIDAFARHATDRAKELGAKNTNFINPHGLHDPNHYTSAYDMALISRELLNQPYFLEIMDNHSYQIPPTNKCDEIRHMSQSHKLLHEARYGRSYRPDVFAGKTGYTTDAGNTLVTMARQGDLELICVVLKSDSYNLYSDTNAILDYGFDNYRSISLHQKDNIIKSIPMYSIKSGQLIHVADCDICVEECSNFLADSNIKERNIDTIINLPDKIDGQASKGDIIGTVSYQYMGKVLYENNLIINEINHLPSAEPTIYPEKPKYAVPNFILSYNTSFLYISLAVICLALLILFIVFINYRNTCKLRKKSKRILRFSKTIK